MTNDPIYGIDPATQQIINNLPGNWQHYAVVVVLILMILGRVATTAATNGGVIPMLKSVFMGSVHATLTPSPAQVASAQILPAPPVTVVTQLPPAAPAPATSQVIQ